MLKKGSGFAFVICCTLGNMPQVRRLAGSVFPPLIRWRGYRPGCRQMQTICSCIEVISIKMQVTVRLLPAHASAA